MRKVISVLVLLFSCSLIVAHEEHEMKQSAQENIEDQLVEEQKLNQDSLFAQINIEYLKIKPIFQKKCFDCHSRFTDYPWYHKLPGVAYMMDEHIKDGLKHLDFSDDFPFKGRGNILEVLSELKEQIKDKNMPLWSYRLLHWGFTIDDEQQDSVFLWIDSSMNQIKQFYDQENIPYDLEEEEED